MVATSKTRNQADAACVRLIGRCRPALPPETIGRVYDGLGGGKSKSLTAGLWAQRQDQAVTCIARRTRDPGRALPRGLRERSVNGIHGAGVEGKSEDVQ